MCRFLHCVSLLLQLTITLHLCYDADDLPRYCLDVSLKHETRLHLIHSSNTAIKNKSQKTAPADSYYVYCYSSTEFQLRVMTYETEQLMVMDIKRQFPTDKFQVAEYFITF